MAIQYQQSFWFPSPILMQECFNSPYGTNYFSSYAEKIPGESTQVLSEAAKESKVYLVGGKEASVAMVTHKQQSF